MKHRAQQGLFGLLAAFAVISLSALLSACSGDGMLELDPEVPQTSDSCLACTNCTPAGQGSNTAAGGGGGGGGGGAGGNGGGFGAGGAQQSQCGGAAGGAGTSGGVLFGGGVAASCPFGGLGLEGGDFGAGEPPPGSRPGNAPPPDDGSDGGGGSGGFGPGGTVELPDGTIVPIGEVSPLDPLNTDQIPGLPCCHVDCPGGPDPECEYVCGNGVQEGPELCDPCPETCDDGDDCTESEVFGVPYFCWAACLHLPLGCFDGDGCCNDYTTLRFCNNLNDNDCPPPPGDVGSPCVDDDQCNDVGVDAEPDSIQGAVCLDPFDTEFPGGYCTRDDAALNGCPEGGDIVEAQFIIGDLAFGFFGSCAKLCDSNADCRPGYECYDVNEDGDTECWLSGTGSLPFGAQCGTVADCAGGPDARCAARFSATQGVDPEAPRYCTETCDQSSETNTCPTDYKCFLNRCQLAPEPENVGGPCTSINDCGGDGITGNRCLSELQGWRDGYCTSFALQTECPPGTHQADGQIGGCAKDCSSDADCRGLGYACLDIDDDGVRECSRQNNGSSDFGGSCEGAWDCGFSDDSICVEGECNLNCFFGTTPCPAGTACGFGTCEPSCQTNADCGPGGFCSNFGGTGEGICFN